MLLLLACILLVNNISNCIHFFPVLLLTQCYTVLCDGVLQKAQCTVMCVLLLIMKIV